MLDFVWKGVSARSLGLYVTEMPPVQTGSARDESYVIPYRDGVLHVQDGTRDPLIKRVSLYLPYEQGISVAAIRAVMEWLRGRGRVSFSDDPGHEYDAVIVNGIDYNAWVQAFDDRVCEVYFDCEPQAYLSNVGDITVTSSGTVIRNPGAGTAKPLLAVTGSGDAQITVQGQTFSLDDLDGTVYVDCRDQEAYTLSDGARTAVNSQMSGEFPAIEPGACEISWTGDVTGVAITPRWWD